MMRRGLSVRSVSVVSSDQVPAALAPVPPGWVAALLGSAVPEPLGAGATAVSAGPLALVRTSVPDAASLGAAALRSAVSDAYEQIQTFVSDTRRHPVRFWNFVPHLGASMGGGLDRYMVFNAGRYDAYARWYGGAGGFAGAVATASAVGVEGADCVMYCLAAAAPGTPVDNPRQTPSWRYSARYGPQPPCFARATIAQLAGQTRLLIGGTASVVGEASRHRGDAAAQVDETVRNLAAVIQQARGRDETLEASLARVSDVRVYVREARDAAAVRSRLQPWCRPGAAVEIAVSHICRPELLVEIEAVAEM